MKRIISLLILAIILHSCFKSRSEKNLLPFTKNDINGKTLYERITKENNYRSYKMWPNHEGFKEGQSPHGRIHRIFVNDIIYNSLPNKKKIAPIGSIIIKENYNIEKELKGLTVMVKVKDFDPDTNDWYWANYDTKGNVLLSGKVPFCSDCHIGMKNNDYIIVQPLDN